MWSENALDMYVMQEKYKKQLCVVKAKLQNVQSIVRVLQNENERLSFNLQLIYIFILMMMTLMVYEICDRHGIQMSDFTLKQK